MNTVELVQNDLDRLVELGLVFKESPDHTNFWNRRYGRYQKQLIDNDLRVRPDVLTQFARNRLFIGDNPKTEVNSRSWLQIVRGDLRGERNVLLKCLEILEESGFEDLLVQYPVPAAGSPYVFDYKGYRYTHRWCRMIYHLGLMNKYLAGRLTSDFIALDIGAHCGMFSGLVHQEYVGSTQVVVDLPESLLLARYYLTLCFPDARIAGIREISEVKSTTRSFLKQYDFVLLPSQFYRNLAADSVDLISSFACIGGLKRSYFDFYMDAPVCKTAKFLYTANPVDSSTWFDDSDLSILDYPVWGDSRKLHFRLSPIYFHSYSRPKRHYMFFHRRSRFHVFFEYIGEINVKNGFTCDSESAGQSRGMPESVP